MILIKLILTMPNEIVHYTIQPKYSLTFQRFQIGNLTNQFQTKQS